MFKVTGISGRKGAYKVRFANDMSRVKILVKNGFDEVELIEMPTALDKSGCVNFLKASALYERAEFKAAIDAADAKYNGASVVKVSKARTQKPSLEDLKARAAQVADTTEA